MAGALSSALAISDEVGLRTSPPRPANAGTAAAAPAVQSDNAAFAARAETAGRSLAGAAPSFAAGSGDAALVTAGLSGGRLGSSMTDARSAASDAASSSAAVRSTPAFVTGLPPGMWSGHDRRSTADYQTWSYRRIPEQPQTAGGIDLGLLSRPVYPSLPTALRFRYVGAPLWWSNGRSGAEDSTPAARALRAGLSAATSAASIWRSILVASPAWGGFDADDLSGGMDSGADASALGMSSLSRSFDALSATLAAGGGVAAGRAAPAGDAAFIATTRSGQAGAIGSAAATRAARASSVEMSIVAAIPRSPPPLESMGASAASGAEQPHARGKGHAHGQDKEHVEAVSHSKIEGSVDAIAQRIYHRIRRRIESDRERFGG